MTFSKDKIKLTQPLGHRITLIDYFVLYIFPLPLDDLVYGAENCLCTKFESKVQEKTIWSNDLD